jgi:hypothetical protein
LLVRARDLEVLRLLAETLHLVDHEPGSLILGLAGAWPPDPLVAKGIQHDDDAFAHDGRGHEVNVSASAWFIYPAPLAW